MHRKASQSKIYNALLLLLALLSIISGAVTEPPSMLSSCTPWPKIEQPASARIYIYIVD